VAALPIVANTPVYIAAQEGLFTRAGLHVTLKPVTQSTAATADLLHGSVDIITGANFVSFFKAQAAGVLSLKILSEEATCAPDVNEIVVSPHSPITRPADLAGKTIAVNILADIQTMTTNEVLHANGVHTACIHYIVIPFADMAAALAAHRIDAAYEVEPFLSEAEAKIGAEPVLDACTGPTVNIPIGGPSPPPRGQPATPAPRGRSSRPWPRPPPWPTPAAPWSSKSPPGTSTSAGRSRRLSTPASSPPRWTRSSSSAPLIRCLKAAC
jgi:NitT/TauT family transport system substrate-binding protein